MSSASAPSSAPSRVAVAAPAKINLFLDVCGRRDDGYHFLESLVVFTDFGDRITVEPSAELTLSVDGPFAGRLTGDDDGNLVVQAAKALQRDRAPGVGARITLEKNLPVSSGVGGGSADAAAAMRALAILWNVELAETELAAIGLAIGADVPVCLRAAPSLMSGVGETLVPAPPPPSCGVVLANAGEAVSTPSVFSARTGEFSVAEPWPGAEGFDGFVEELAKRKNDLSAPARLVSPVIGDVLGAIAENPDCALSRVSGSGGTCFGIYRDAGAAVRAADRISEDHPQWWCVATAFRDEPPSVEVD